MRLRLFPVVRPAAAAAASVLAASLLVACGGGGFDEESTDSTGGSGSTSETVLASFESGVSAFTVYNDTATTNGSAVGTVETSTENETQGSASAKVTLVASKVLLEVPLGSTTDWSSYRTLLVDVTSTSNIDAADAKLVTKSGTGFAWCSVSPNQAVTAGSTTTLSFRLDWSNMDVCGSTGNSADIKSAYLQIGGGAGNTVYLDNVRLTKAVRVMPLGDSITAASPWRQLLWQDVKSNSPAVDLVGSLNSGETGWDADHEGHGCLQAVEIAAAARDTVITKTNCPTHTGNLEVWLEKSRPDLVMLNLGTNDIWGGIAPATIPTAFDKMVAQLRASNPKMHILAGQILPLSPSGCSDCATRAAAFNAALAEWAQCATTAASPITVVDLATGWDAASMTADGVHPNSTTGAARLAAVWSAPLKTALAGIDTDGSGPAASCGASASDVADATQLSDGTVVLNSFKTGISKLAMRTGVGLAASTVATAALDSSGSNATEGANAAKLNVLNTPSGEWVAAAFEGNGGAADWSGFRYLRVDAKADANGLSAQLVVQSKADFTGWCTTTAKSLSANASGTFELDLSSCGSNADLTKVQRYQLAIWNTSGTYYIDNVRLVPASAVSATDTADATVVNSTTTQLYSFREGLSGMKVFETNSTENGVLATASWDQGSSFATEGSNAVKVVMADAVVSSKGNAMVGFRTDDGTLTVTDWSKAKYLKVDMTATGGVWWAQVVTQSGDNFAWCTLGQDGPSAVAGDGKTAITQPGTAIFDLSKLACGDTGSNADYVPSDIKRFFLLVQGTSGTYYIDNIRLTTD